MIKRILSLALCLAVGVCSLTASVSAQETAESSQYLSNADLMPKYLPDKYVQLEASDEDGELMTPDWLKSSIMVEVRIEKCSEEGTLEAAIPMLDHYQELGVNLLWVTPIYHKESDNGYTSYGPHTIDPGLTGTTDYEEGWERFAWFVRQAHNRNIRIMLDFVTWGVSYESPLLKEHPELFSGEEVWGGAAFDWESPVFLDWYKSQAIDIVMKTGIDGIRADCEPLYTGYDMYREIRQELLKRGRKIVIMGEVENERLGTFDLDQNGVMSFDNWDHGSQYFDPQPFYVEKFNIVDSVKNGQGIGSLLGQQLEDGGKYRFYTYALSHHDYSWNSIKLNLIHVGYQAIFAPFIPLWYMGEENGTDVRNHIFYFGGYLGLDLLEQKENREFYETLKKYIRIRRSYPSVFEYFPLNHRESNICKVDVAGLENLQAYARFDDQGNGILIVPNNNINNTAGHMTVSVPFADMNMQNYKQYTVTDLMTGKQIASGSKRQTGIFDTQVASGEIGVYLVKGTQPIADNTVPNEDHTSSSTSGAASSTEESTLTTADSTAPSDTTTVPSTAPEESAGISQTTSPDRTTAAGSTDDLPAMANSTNKTGLIVTIVVMSVLVLGGAIGLVLLYRRKTRRT